MGRTSMMFWSVLKSYIGFTRNFETVDDAKNDAFLRVGQSVKIKERQNYKFTVVAGVVGANEMDVIQRADTKTSLVVNYNNELSIESLGASSLLVDNIAIFNRWISVIKSNAVKGIIHSNLPIASTAHFPSGDYLVDMRLGGFIVAPSVTEGVTIGDTGGSTFTGIIQGLRVVKEAFNDLKTDYGVTYRNMTEATIETPYVKNFTSNLRVAPTTGERVAYVTTKSPRLFEHVFGVDMEPSGTGYANENTFSNGRCHVSVANRLNSHIRLYDADLTRQFLEHNRFLGISIEGYSGGGASGNRAVWCQQASHNYFEFCRTEEYNEGWQVEAYHFEGNSEHNLIIDSRPDARVLDTSTANGQEYQSPTAGRRYSMKNGAGDVSADLVVRHQTPITKHAQHIKDIATSGPILLQKLESLQAVAAPRTNKMVVWKTAFGEVFVCDDAGTLKPRDNFATLGAAGNRYNGVFSLLNTYADDAAAGVGGLGAGAFYKTATGEVRIKL